MLNKKSKKAQISQTMTWMIATIIIFVILVIFISATAGLTDKKNFLGLGNFVEDNGSRVVEQQMVFAIINKDNQKIKNLIKTNEDQAKQEIDKILLDFKNKKGIDCDYRIKNKQLELDCNQNDI